MAKSGTFSNLHDWLISEDFTSSRQARLHSVYLGWLSLVANPLAFAGFAVVLLLIIVAALAPVIAVHDPFAQDFLTALQAPSAAHWFGTDEFGRDVFSRLVYGARTTLYITILVTVIVAPIGFLIGSRVCHLRSMQIELFGAVERTANHRPASKYRERSI